MEYFEYLYDQIEIMRQRPAMYLGKNSITLLCSFLHGYQAALMRCYTAEMKPQKLFPLSFVFFNDYVYNNFYNYAYAMDWCYNILRGNNNNEEESLLVFYELFDRFKVLTIENSYAAVIDKEAVDFHYHNERTAYRWKDNMRIPMYESPIDAWLIELSSNAGHICLINTEKEHSLLTGPIIGRIYKTRRDVDINLESCFGSVLSWVKVEGDNIIFDKDCVF